MPPTFNGTKLKSRLIKEFGSGGEYALFPRSLWKMDVETNQPYWDWVVARSYEEEVLTRDYRIIYFAENGMHPSRIAEKLNVSIATVHRVRTAAGAPMVHHRRGTEDDKLKAKALLEDGASYQEVARTIGFSGSTISRWFPGYTWSDKQKGEASAMARKMNQIERLSTRETKTTE